MPTFEVLFSFNGRIRRFEFWVKGILALVLLTLVGNSFWALLLTQSGKLEVSLRFLLYVYVLLYNSALLWSSIALVVKRWHDRNRSAWWLLATLVPILGLVPALWILVEACFLKGTAGPNRYGDAPRVRRKRYSGSHSSVINRLWQVVSVTLVNLQTIPERKGAAIAAAVGIAGVVAVLVGVLSIAAGFRAAMSTSGADDIALVLRSGADTEMTSGLSREETRLIADGPGLARDADGPLTSAELFVIINLPKRSTGTDANVPFRGVEKAAFAVRDDVRIIEGRKFELGRNEVIVGAGAARAFSGLDVGNKIRLGQNDWEIVGVFKGGGGSAESEMWTDAAVLQPAYNRGDSFQSLYAKLSSPAAFEQFNDALTTNPRLKVKVVRQVDFLADQSSMLTTFIQGFGVFIAAMMALGALFGALNTMYSAVAARTREIATLRALGFGSGSIILSVTIESLVLALIGGTLGAAAAYFAFDGFKAATINWQTFSQIAFAFAVTPQLLVSAIIWAVTIGLIGGFFPAIRAIRMPIAAALRAM